jgi:hypothetical protein
VYKPSAQTLNKKRNDQLNVVDAGGQEYSPHSMLSFTVKNRDNSTTRISASALHKISKFSLIKNVFHLSVLNRLLKYALFL